jgi:hypothetical protein
LPAGLESIVLSNNQLSGPIPDISALAYLEVLVLRNNQMEGTVPTWVCHARFDLDVGFNKLMGEADSCVTANDPDWAATQTVPPTNVQALRMSPTSAELTWTPILYTGDGGYYEVRCGTTSGGPYTSQGKTADKTAATLTVTGLTPATPTYCVLRTFTPRHGDQQNDLTSIDSVEVQVAATTFLPE